MTGNDLAVLLRQMEWADARTWRAVRRMPRIPWTAELEERCGPTSSCTVGEMFLQAFAHTSHHRGQVMARLRALGGEPPLTDFIAWVWFGKPDPEWPSRDA